jgi:hypothetical protein
VVRADPVAASPGRQHHTSGADEPPSLSREEWTKATLSPTEIPFVRAAFGPQVNPTDLVCPVAVSWACDMLAVLTLDALAHSLPMQNPEPIDAAVVRSAPYTADSSITNDVRGRIALILRGNVPFVDKARRAMHAGAIERRRRLLLVRANS